MALNTLTLTSSGRLPGALGATPTASSIVIISSGVIGVLPFVTSGFTCLYLSCLGLDSVSGGRGKPGSLGASMNAGYRHGSIYQLSASRTFNGGVGGGAAIIRVTPCRLERTTGGTEVVTGGGTN